MLYACAKAPGMRPRPCQPYTGDGEGGYSPTTSRLRAASLAVQPGGDRRELREGDDRGAVTPWPAILLSTHYRGWQEAPRRGNVRYDGR